jgi:hypothetical protein
VAIEGPFDPILVCTDCECLIHVMEARWRLKLQEKVQEAMVPFYQYQQVCEICIGKNGGIAK